MASYQGSDRVMLGLIILTVCFHPALPAGAKGSYYMDKTEDCSFIGVIDVTTDQTVTINAKQSAASSSSVVACNLQFRAADERDYFDLSFSNFYINDCDVVLFISLGGGSTGSSSYSCGTPPPGSMMSTTGQATIRLDRKYINKNDYQFSLRLRAYKPSQIYPPTDANPQLVGLVVGIVGGVIAFIVIIAVIAICCYRKKKKIERQHANEDYKENLDEESNMTYGYDNDGRNGGQDYEGTPGSNKRLLLDKDFEKKVSKGKDTRYTEYNEGDSSNSSGERKTPLIESYSTSPKKSMSFDYDGAVKNDRKNKDGRQEDEGPKSPILSALHSNPKFRKSFHENEVDADDRAKRISSYSSGPDSPTEASYAERSKPVAKGKVPVAKGKVPVAPPLPIVPKSPGQKRSNYASIRRAPRPSSSSGEIQHIERGEFDDRDIKVIRNREDPPSPSEVVPIKVSDPNKPSHTLKPNRGKKSPKEKRKQSEVSKQNDEPYEERVEKEGEKGKGREKFQKNTGLRRSSRKSPRVGRGSRPSMGSVLDDNESIASGISRMTRDDYDDDLDSNYQPLRRSGSRQSLYASRSSLYGRRRRERHGSMSESVMSYARDDIDAYSEQDFEERKISRRESMRKGFRSLGDLEYESREISTQTLRETASQTGRGRVASTTPKKGASKKVAARKHSTGSTASRKPKKKPSINVEDEEETEAKDTESVSSSVPKTKTKSKSEKPKIQPKPKPAPRKSTSAKQHENDTASEAGTIPQTEAPAFTAASGAYPAQMIPGGPYPMMQQGHPYIPPGSVPMMQYPGYPGVFPGQTVPPVMYAPQVPPQVRPPAPGLPPGQGHSQGQPSQAGKSGKSSWDLLCSMTEQEKAKSSDTESASVTGSMFSQQNPNPYVPVSYPQPGVPYPQGYPPGGVPQGYAPSGTMSFAPHSYMPSVSGPVSDYGSGAHTGSGPYPASSTSSQSSEESDPPAVKLPSAEKVFPRQASWEVLDKMAKAEKRQDASSNKTESIV